MNDAESKKNKKEKIKMMDDKIIFKPEKGTASYNPLIDNIKDTNSQEAFAGAKLFASVLGIKHCSSIGLILFVRFSKTIPKKDKTLVRLNEILKSGISFKTVLDIGCVKDSGQDWYEMDALITTLGCLRNYDKKFNVNQ